MKNLKIFFVIGAVLLFLPIQGISQSGLSILDNEALSHLRFGASSGTFDIGSNIAFNKIKSNYLLGCAGTLSVNTSKFKNDHQVVGYGMFSIGPIVGIKIHEFPGYQKGERGFLFVNPEIGLITEGVNLIEEGYFGRLSIGYCYLPNEYRKTSWAISICTARYPHGYPTKSGLGVTLGLGIGVKKARTFFSRDTTR